MVRSLATPAREDIRLAPSSKPHTYNKRVNHALWITSFRKGNNRCESGVKIAYEHENGLKDGASLVSSPAGVAKERTEEGEHADGLLHRHCFAEEL